MRALLLIAMILVAFLIIVYMVIGNSIKEYMKYHKIGLSCFDKDTGTFNEALDEAVLASDEVNDIEAMGYRKGRERAKERFLKAQNRYEKFRGQY